MAQSENPWHICDDCLDPLAHELLQIARRMPIFFDVAKRDRLDTEYHQILEASGYSRKRMTDAQRKRQDELTEEMRAQTDPPTYNEVDRLYPKYRIKLAIDWLKFNVSVEYADDFKRTVLGAKRRFSALEIKACQILNGDEGEESTILVRYAIQRLLERHRELLREMFPDHEHHPDRDELPDALRAFEVEILDEYAETEHEIRETALYLRRVSALVRSKMKKADLGEIQRQIAEGFQAAQTRSAGRDCTDTVAQTTNHKSGESDQVNAVECHVTLRQMAAIVNKSKRTLERLYQNGKLPAPAVEGGKGKAYEWRWSDIKPILETQYDRQLPKTFPSDQFIRR